VLENALRDAAVGKVALVSSFGAESVVLLHLISVIDRKTPVIFIDTEMLFAETLTYQMELAERLHLADVRMIRADRGALFTHDNEGLLHLYDTDACCDLRKTQPLQKALDPFDAWITGRKRYQGGQRTSLGFFENEDDLRIKINPLAHWQTADVAEYIAQNRLPRHPLVAKGYPSIGCSPCTTRVNDGEDPRAGRWRDTDKDECGIHYVNGRVVRGGVAA
jgi:phosphoadenosine phosphosulfate reductase